MKFIEQLEPYEIAIITENKGIIYVPETIENIRKKVETGYLEIKIKVDLDRLIAENIDIISLFLVDFEPTLQKYLDWSSKNKIYLTTYDT